MEKNPNDTLGVIAYAKEIGAVPQFLYAQIREGKLAAHTCQCGHLYVVRSEADAWNAKRKAKKA